MPNLPKPSNFVASVLGVMVVAGIFVFVIGLGLQWLKYKDTEFGLITGFLFSSGGIVLAFYFGSSKQSERAAELAAQPPSVPVPPPGTRVERQEKTTTTTTPVDPVVGAVTPPDAERLAKLQAQILTLPPGPERDKLAADIAALREKVAKG